MVAAEEWGAEMNGMPKREGKGVLTRGEGGGRGTGKRRSHGFLVALLN